MKKTREELPIAKSRADVIESVYANYVTCIAGETGSGKSSQVPQYLYEQSVADGVDPLIIVTQPRRMAAVQLARRVAAEMGSKVGGVVGYRIGGEHTGSLGAGGTKIVFVTAGWLLTYVS